MWYVFSFVLIFYFSFKFQGEVSSESPEVVMDPGMTNANGVLVEIHVCVLLLVTEQILSSLYKIHYNIMSLI